MPITPVPTANLRRSRLTAALALFLVILLGAFFVRGVVDVQSLLGEIRDNDLAETQIESVLIDLIDAETGQRGFLLTGDERYLEPYQRGRKHIQEMLRSQQRFGYMREQLGADGEAIMRLAEGKLEELGVRSLSGERTIRPPRSRSSSKATEKLSWIATAFSSSGTWPGCGMSATSFWTTCT